MNRLMLVMATIALLLPACRSERDAVSDSATDSASMTGMAGMSGDVMRHMMDSMEAHLRMMDTASAASMQTMMAMHHPMADSLVSRMDADMRRMNMAGDSAWTTTVDSVRADLGRMHAMTPDNMKAVMPQHRARMMRLMEMHRRMMPPR
jgi:hypothetical protein